MTDLRPSHNLAGLFTGPDVTSISYTARGLSVAFHDAADRREAATFAALTGWTFNQINAVVSQSGTVNGVDLDLYSKADAEDWRRFHEANGPLRQGGAA